MDTKIRELMIPLQEYPKIAEGASLSQAVKILEAAHENLKFRNYKARAVLVTDAAGRVVGKLNMWGCLRALEPKYQDIADFDRLTHFGLNPDFLRSMVDSHGLWVDPFDALCSKAAERHVRDFMTVPGQDEYVEADDNVVDGIHHLLMGKHMSLLVREGDEVVGIFRLSDVFEFVTEKIKNCGV
ncbi:MAG: hypothetical protein KQJ78_16265 [Deltaproteobacteria bacterium]|nr:hypothetical protein [Deltaproteobacteria bacterium]